MNDRANDARLRRDVPVASTGDGAWGSDAIAALLRDMEIPYVVLNPGRAIEAFTTASSITSATSGRRCCSSCTRSTPSPSRTATRR